jgi:methyl-accepting chemotaxis protein
MKQGQVRFSIKTRMILLVGLVIALIVVTTSIFSYYNAQDMMGSAIAREAQTIAEKNAQIISVWFQAIEDEMELFTLIPAVRNLELEEARAIMDELIKERPEYGGILLADRFGTATTVEGLTIDISQRDYFIDALAKGQAVYSGPLVTQGTNLATIMIARPVYGANSREPVGVAAFSVTLEYMQEIAESMHLAGHGHGWLMSGSKVIVGHPDPAYLGNADLFAEEPALQPIVDRMAAGDSGVTRYGLGREAKVIAYAPIEQNGWSVAVEAYEREVLGILATIRTIIILSVVVSLAIGFALAYGLANSVAKPILALTKSAEKVSEGDLTEVITVRRGDEIGLLASSFGQMIDNLSHILENVKSSSVRVLDTANQLSAATEETGASIEEMASSANHFSQTVSSMNKSVVDASGSAARITAMAAEGEAALEKTAQQTEELRLSIQELSEIIASLNASSSEIENIVQTISAIAEQTNLLSLNAAIEAARAGEHGRGFAVVAEEVRKLSEESSSAAAEIRDLITEVQQKTHQAVDGMQRSVIHVDETSQVVGDSGRLLSTIISGINEIGGRIEEIGEDTRAIDLGAQEMAASTEEQSATIEEIASSVQGLSEMAQELQSLIERFKMEQD